MFKFRFFSLVIVLVMLVLGLSAAPVFADTGGIKVDDDMLCADDPTEKASDRETNLLANNATAYIWLNSPPPGDTTLYCEVTAQGDSKDAFVAAYTLTFTQCLTGNLNYWWAAFTTPLPAAPGVYVYTIECFTELNGDNIGRDTWRQILE